MVFFGSFLLNLNNIVFVFYLLYYYSIECVSMVATVGVYQYTAGSDGNPGTDSEITASTRLQTKDQFSPSDTTYPIPIPTSGFKYSFWVHVGLKITGGSFTKINNIKFWSDGAVGWTFGATGELRIGNRDAGDIGCPMATEYDIATGTDGDTGDAIEDVTNGHGYYNGQTTKTRNVTYWTSGNKATIDSTDHVAAERCKAAVLQAKVASDGTQGEQADETLTFSYDEI